MTLSITASINRPNDDTSPRARATMPSNQSVNAAAIKSQKVIVGAQSKSRFISQTIAKIGGTRETVSQLARVKQMTRSEDTRQTLGNPMIRLPNSEYSY